MAGLTLATLLTGSVNAGDVFEIDTTNGTINGAASNTINGVPIAYSGLIAGSTVAQFLVYGDLVLTDGQRLMAFGAHGASLLVALYFLLSEAMKPSGFLIVGLLASTAIVNVITIVLQSRARRDG